MNRIKEGLMYICGRIRDFGRWLWETKLDEKIFFTMGLVVLMAVVFGAAKIWNIAISDVGYYDNFQGADFIIMRGQTIGYTICWTKAESNEIEACIEARKR